MNEKIPNAPFYVLSKDTFMSEWGIAEGKTNTCVVPCEDYTEARRVMAYVKTRKEQKRIRIVARKPIPKAHVVYSLVMGWKNRAKEIERNG